LHHLILLDVCLSARPLGGLTACGVVRRLSNARRGTKVPTGSKNSRAAANKAQGAAGHLSPAPSGKTDCSLLGDIF
jgi:hypothetical protein